MTKYELTLVVRGEKNDFRVHRTEKVIADDIVSLLAQFQVVVASVLKSDYEKIIMELRSGISDDDLPF